MSTRSSLACVSVYLGLLVAGCGGSGSDLADAGPKGTNALLPTHITVDGRMTSTCMFNPTCSGNPYAPFIVFNDPAPPDGATLSGIVRLQARGIDMANVELLPATGYLPKYGFFGLSRDQFVGWLDFDTRTLPNGPVQVRMSAFNVAAGQPGAIEMVSMQPRTWIINNAAIPAGFGATLAAAPPAEARVSGTIRLEIRGTGITNAELLPASGYAPRHGQFNVSADKTVAWLDFDTRGLPDGPADLRISAFNVAPGQPGAIETIPMATRRWHISNGNDGSFTARVATAPMHGATVTGWVTVEVQGTGIKNVELLPAGGYTPIIANFVESFDGTFAFLDVDTSTLPAGPMDVRVSAFDTPPGQSGAREIVVMHARQWIVRH